MIRTKRVYEPAAKTDGVRYLVERLWPRGMRKEALKMDGWLRDVAPSPELRQWFAHDPPKWPEFQRRYRRELDQGPAGWQPLAEAARQGTVTLLYSAHDTERNSAVLLKSYLDEKAGGAAEPKSKTRGKGQPGGEKRSVGGRR